MSSPPQRSSNSQVLVAASTADSLSLIINLLRNEGLTTTECTTASETWTRLQQGQSEIALVDLGLSDIRSHDVFQSVDETNGWAWGIFTSPTSPSGHGHSGSKPQVSSLIKRGSDPSTVLLHIYKVLWNNRWAHTSHPTPTSPNNGHEAHASFYFEGSQHPMWVCDRETLAFLAVNDAAIDHYGYSRHEFLEMSLQDIGLPDALTSPTENGEGSQSLNHPASSKHRTRNGQLIDVEISGFVTEYNGRPAEVVLAYDVTARQKAEEALVRSETRYRALYDHNPTMYFTVSSIGTVLSVNQFGVDQLGYSRDELVGQSVFGIFHAEDQGSVKVHLTWCLEHPTQVGHWELRKVRKDGSVVWVKETARVVQHSDGTTVVLIVCEEITDRKGAEQAIRDLYDIASIQHRSFEERIRSLLALGCQRFGLPHGMLTQWKDSNLELAYIQSPDEGFVEGMLVPQCQSFCGAALDTDGPLGIEWAGESEWRQHPAYTALGLEAYLGTKVMVGNEKYGTLCFASSSPYPTTFSEADKDFLQLMARWIGGELERSRTDEALRESVERFNLAVQGSQDGLWDAQALSTKPWHSPDTPVWYSPRFKEMLGYKDHEFENCGASFFLHLHPEDQERTFTALSDHIERKVPYDIEYRLRTKTGAYRWFSARGQATWDHHGHVARMSGSFRDITKIKQVEEDLRESEEQLLDALEQRERISRDLHDGILQSLYAVGLLLETTKGVMREDICQATSQVDQAVAQLNMLMREIRHFIAGIKPDVQLTSGDLGQTLTALIQSMAPTPNTKFRIHLAPTALAVLTREQRDHIFNVMREGISNALRHGQARKGSISFRSLKKGLRLTIRDDGKGFDVDKVSKKGQGLKNISVRAAMLGGTFHVKSRPGNGTRLALYIPTTHTHGTR